MFSLHQNLCRTSFLLLRIRQFPDTLVNILSQIFILRRFQCNEGCAFEHDLKIKRRFRFTESNGFLKFRLILKFFSLVSIVSMCFRVVRVPQAEIVGQMIIFGEWCREPAKTGERVHLMFYQLLVMSDQNGKLQCVCDVKKTFFTRDTKIF